MDDLVFFPLEFVVILGVAYVGIGGFVGSVGRGLWFLTVVWELSVKFFPVSYLFVGLLIGPFFPGLIFFPDYEYIDEEEREHQN